MPAKWGCTPWGTPWGTVVSNVQVIALPFSPPAALITWDSLHPAGSSTLYQVYVNGEFYDHTSEFQMEVVLSRTGRFYVEVVAAGPGTIKNTSPIACFTPVFGDAIKLTWAHGASWGVVPWGTTPWGDDAERYRVYWDEGTLPGTTTLLGETSELEFTTEDLEDGTYTFRVVAVDAAGNEAAGVTVIVVHDRPPTPVANLLLTSFTAPTTFTATWTPSPSSDVLTYFIYSNGGSGPIDYSTAVASVAAPAAGHTWTDAAVAGDWQIAVRAFDGTFLEDNVSEFYSFELGGAPLVLRSPKPATPYDLLVTPIAGGALEIAVKYNPTSEDAVGSVINLYYDSGSGTIDFSSIFATIAIPGHDLARPGVYDLSFTTAFLADGVAYLFAAKAAAASSLESAASETASAVADATPPADVYTLAGGSAFATVPAPLPDATIPGTV